MTAIPRILIVEDDRDSRHATVRLLQRAGYETSETDKAGKAVDLVLKHDIDILVGSHELPGAKDLFKTVKSIQPRIEVVVIVGRESNGAAVEALKAGAYDFITKPVSKPCLLRVIERAVEKQQLERENFVLRAQLQGRSSPVVHNGSEMNSIMKMVAQVGSSSVSVLISGESGTGKEVVADAIHAASPRRDRPLVKVDCAGTPEPLFEAELLRVESASGCTVFLDEIGEIAPAVQQQLLHFLNEAADVRIIAATSKELRREVAEGRFREDLFGLLNVVSINLPPLRDRRSDIPLLAMHFLRFYAAKNQKKIDGFSDAAMQALVAYEWAGNVRELESAVERAVSVTSTRLIPLSVFRRFMPQLAESQPSLTFKVGTSWHDLERQAIEVALARSHGDKMTAARLLGVSPRTIYRYLYRLE
jgi:DNA-binding NtrC family response regulator